ncbi:MAG: hypothetical protein IKC32_02145 [Clostridia bacterium]|nr:hypothetical protein [Clostridia bacterium]
MFEKIFYEFFLLNLNEFPNINIDFEINVLLFFIAVAICICSVIVTLYRSALQRLIKQLKRLGASDEESARTLGEMGLTKSLFVKMALSREGRLTRIVGRVGETIYTYEEMLELTSRKGGYRHEKVDFDTARFYIRADRADDAKNIIENYGTSMLRTGLYCVMVIAIYVCLALIMPEILSLLDGMLGSF